MKFIIVLSTAIYAVTVSPDSSPLAFRSYQHSNSQNIYQISLNRSFKTLSGRADGDDAVHIACVECPCSVSTFSFFHYVEKRHMQKDINQRFILWLIIIIGLDWRLPVR
jgi:hypothetical protein